MKVFEQVIERSKKFVAWRPKDVLKNGVYLDCSRYECVIELDPAFFAPGDKIRITVEKVEG